MGLFDKFRKNNNKTNSIKNKPDDGLASRYMDLWVKLQKASNQEEQEFINVYKELMSLMVEWNHKYPQDCNLQLAQLIANMGHMSSDEGQKQLDRILNQYKPLDESMNLPFVNTCKQMIMLKKSMGN